MRKEIRILDLRTLRRSWQITENIGANSPQWLGSSSNLIWLEPLRNGYTNLVIRDARLVDNEYIAGPVPGHISNLRVTSIPFIEDTDDDLGFAVVGKVHTDGSLFNPTEQSSTFDNVAGHSHTKRRADWFTSPQNSIIWFGTLTRPSEAPNGRYVMGKLTNLMDHFKLTTISLRITSGQEEDCRDFDINSWAIAFVGSDFDEESQQSSCSCYVCPMLRCDGYPLDSLYYAFSHRGLGGNISSPILKHNDTTVAFLSQKTRGYSSDKNRVIFIHNNQTSESEELFESQDGKWQWDLSPSAITYWLDRSLLIQVEENGRQALYKLNLDNWWPDKPTPASLELLSSFLPYGSIVNVTPMFSESSKSALLISCHALNHSKEYVIFDPQSPGRRRAAHLLSIFPAAKSKKFGHWAQMGPKCIHGSSNLLPSSLDLDIQ